MSYLIIKPDSRGEAYDNAAEIFKSMCEKATGISIKIALEDDGKSDLFIIGSGAVNKASMKYFLNGTTPSFGIRYGSDGYCVRSFKDGERNIVVFAGGRGRSTIYAIYGYFEKHLGCSYFWDGDIIPKAEKLPNEDIEINEEPRFIYRGTRYFAHRGLWRFQAEHRSLDDWKNEIDWMLKKRLNFFMLRICVFFIPKNLNTCSIS